MIAATAWQALGHGEIVEVELLARPSGARGHGYRRTAAVAGGLRAKCTPGFSIGVARLAVVVRRDDDLRPWPPRSRMRSRYGLQVAGIERDGHEQAGGLMDAGPGGEAFGDDNAVAGLADDEHAAPLAAARHEQLARRRQSIVWSDQIAPSASAHGEHKPALPVDPGAVGATCLRTR